MLFFEVKWRPRTRLRTAKRLIWYEFISNRGISEENTMDSILVHILVTNSVLCLILGTHWLLGTALQPLPSRLLGANYGMYSLQGFLLVLHLIIDWQPLLNLRGVLAMLVGPCLYFYYLSVVTKDWTFRAIDIGHFLPALVMVGLLVWAANTVGYFILASFTVYLALSLVKLSKGDKALVHLGKHAPLAYRWLCFLTVLMFVNWCIDVGVMVEIANGTMPRESLSILLGSVFFLVVNGFTLVASLRRNSFLEWMQILGDEGVRAILPPSVNDEDAQRLFEQWAQLVRNEQLYKREGGLTLKDAGKRMGIAARKLSVAVNRIYGASFSQYLNDLRVQEVKKLLLEQPELKLTDVMLEAGFGTKSAFNKEFQRVESMSPGEYRQRI